MNVVYIRTHNTDINIQVCIFIWKAHFILICSKDNILHDGVLSGDMSMGKLYARDSFAWSQHFILKATKKNQFPAIEQHIVKTAGAMI